MSHQHPFPSKNNPVIRQEIKDSALSDRKLAERYNISRSTARKWQQREDTEDRPHPAHTLHTNLTELETTALDAGGRATQGAVAEPIVVSLHETLYLPLDDLLYVTKTVKSRMIIIIFNKLFGRR